MKIPFFILGLLLRYGPRHGYRLKQIIEEEVSDFAKIKLPTIYYHLDKLKENGHVTETIGKDGNRPEKMVYKITETGKKYFEELLTEQLKASYSPEFSIDGVLYFRERAEHVFFREELEKKKREIEIKLQILERHQANALDKLGGESRLSAELIFEHHRFHLQAELMWLKKAIGGLSK
jgi:DNA-binding PadR family transcriptional regulator